MAQGVASLVAEGGRVRRFAHPKPVAHDHDGAAERPHQASQSKVAPRASSALSNQRTSSWCRNQVDWRFA